MKSFLKKIIRLTGHDVIAHNPWTNSRTRMKLLLQFHRVGHVLDVGANEGQFAQRLRREFGYRGFIDSFEPTSATFSRLFSAASNDSTWRCHQYGLGDSDTELDINLSENSVSSSILPMQAQHTAIAPESRYVGTERVAVRRLDSVFADLIPPGAAVFLKVDVQGYEGQVIRGASNALRNIALVQLEVSLISLYESESSFVDIVRAMVDSGFDLVGAEPALVNDRSGHVLQMDLIFANRGLNAGSA
jgi:FkbM family methyltransferase